MWAFAMRPSPTRGRCLQTNRDVAVSRERATAEQQRRAFQRHGAEGGFWGALHAASISPQTDR